MIMSEIISEVRVIFADQSIRSCYNVDVLIALGFKRALI